MKDIAEIILEVREREKDIWNQEHMETLSSYIRKTCEKDGFYVIPDFFAMTKRSHPPNLDPVKKDFPKMAQRQEEWMEKMQKYNCIRVDIHHLPHPEDGERLMHKHCFFEMIYVYRGSFVNMMPLQTFTLHQGDILILNPNVLHCPYTISDDDVVFNFFINPWMFQQLVMPILSRNQVFSYFFSDFLYLNTNEEKYLYFKDNNDPQMIGLLLDIVKEFYNNRLHSQDVMIATLTLLFAHLSRVYEEQNKMAVYQIDQNKLIYEIINYISKHHKDATRESLANHFGYSKSYISRIVKRHSNKTFSEFQQYFRMQKAGEYLKNSNLSISEIAEKVGWNDPIYFGKLFKQTFFQTPAQYRKKA